MKTYWLIWALEDDSPNGYNQAVFKTLKEFMDFLEDAYYPYDDMEGFVIRTVEVADWPQAMAIVDLCRLHYEQVLNVRTINHAAI